MELPLKLFVYNVGKYERSMRDVYEGHIEYYSI